jgi:hypothetical protein
MALDRFSADVLEKLRWYVYRLINPMNDETFYVGKGEGNRVFQHVRGHLEPDDDELMSAKIELIRDILSKGLFVRHVIHRHGLDENVAFEVEAALIEAYPNLTNIQDGRGNFMRGSMTAEEIIELYTLDEAVIEHKLIIIDVSRSFGRKKGKRESVLDAVRFMWRLDKARAKKCDYVLAQRGGVIIGIFQPEKWLDATRENFPEFEENIRKLEKRGAPKRIGFVGHEVTAPQVISLYKNKRVPAELRQAPRAPCRYVNM